MAPVWLPSPACIPENHISLSVHWPQALSRRELGLWSAWGRGPLPARRAGLARIGVPAPAPQYPLVLRAGLKGPLWKSSPAPGSCLTAVWGLRAVLSLPGLRRASPEEFWHWHTHLSALSAFSISLFSVLLSAHSCSRLPRRVSFF